MFAVFTILDGRKAFWTGRVLSYRAPDLTFEVAKARKWSTAREAYDQAGKAKAPALLEFNVGKLKLGDEIA